MSGKGAGKGQKPFFRERVQIPFLSGISPSSGRIRPFVIRKGRFIPNPAKFPLSTVSECVIQEESAGECGHHIYGLATVKVDVVCEGQFLSKSLKWSIDGWRIHQNQYMPHAHGGYQVPFDRHIHRFPTVPSGCSQIRFFRPDRSQLTH